MSDLPIYPDASLRTRLQFSALERLRGVDTRPAWEKSDEFIAQLEGARNVRQAREEVQEVTKSGLLKMHALTFTGVLRQNSLAPLFRGQDCPDPQFIDRSLDNFFSWLTRRKCIRDSSHRTRSTSPDATRGHLALRYRESYCRDHARQYRIAAGGFSAILCSSGA